MSSHKHHYSYKSGLLSGLGRWQPDDTLGTWSICVHVRLITQSVKSKSLVFANDLLPVPLQSPNEELSRLRARHEISTGWNGAQSCSQQSSLNKEGQEWWKDEEDQIETFISFTLVEIMFYFHCWCCPFNAEVNNYRNTSLMWVLMRSRVVSHCFAFMPAPNSWQRPADVNYTTKPEQSNTSSLQHATTFSHLKSRTYSFSGYEAIFTTNYLTLPSYGTRNFYSLHTEWNLWKRFKLKNDDWLCEG